MDIAHIISDDYVEFAPETRVSKLISTFDDPTVRGVVVSGDEFKGVVTRRELATTRHRPDEPLDSLIWHVPRLAPDEDIRTVAQLMLDSDSHLLPVSEDEQLRGVVTVDGILDAVQQFLDAVTVADASSTDLVTADPDATVGDTLGVLREHHITHLPVVEDGTAVGMLSLYDLTGFTVRATATEETDATESTDSAGDEGDGGFRERDRERLLDRPVGEVMVSPVRTIGPGATLDVAVAEMFDIGGSSLVVTGDDGPVGIVTKTDVLDALTWEAGDERPVQVYGIDRAPDLDEGDIVRIIDELDARDAELSVLAATVHLHERDEQRRGESLVRARVRLHTDRGVYVGTGEQYGASGALNDARDELERQFHGVRTSDGRAQSRRERRWEDRFGWLLGE